MFPIVIMAIENDEDREFMKQLYMKHRISMFKMARSLTKSNVDAEDVVSDVCVSLIKKIDHIQQLDCNVLEGYIVSTVKNTAFTLYRRRQVRKEVVDFENILEFEIDKKADMEELLVQQCNIDEMMDAIDHLAYNDQFVIRMKYFQRCSDKEIAEALCVKEVTVRSRLTRSRQRLYKVLEGKANVSGE